MGSQYQAANIVPPFDRGSNEFAVKKFTATTTHRADALPRSWTGKYVTMYATTGTVHFAFSKSSSAEVDATVAATDAGASAKVGGVLTSTPRHVRIPGPVDAESTMYFVREAEAAGAIVVMELSSN